MSIFLNFSFIENEFFSHTLYPDYVFLSLSPQLPSIQLYPYRSGALFHIRKKSGFEGLIIKQNTR